MKKPQLSGIYLIRDTESGLIKIGKSQDVLKRLQQLQTGSASKLRLLAVVQGNEKEIHARFNDFRIRGEWFVWAEPIFDFLNLPYCDDCEKILDAFCSSCGKEVVN